MRRLLTGFFTVISCGALVAQTAQAPSRATTPAGQPGASAQAPLPATDIKATDITAFLNALPRDVISDRAIRTVNVGGYQVGVYGVFRPKSLAGDAILHETTTSEIYYMLDGSATLVTGGKLAGPKPPQGNSTSPRGERIEGGVSRKVVKGDVVIIPGRTPHWWSQLDGDIQYLIFRPDPDSRLSLK
jgi:mannose-6-phosphate isomerase-like protein (cupin superfamily)